MDELIQIIMVFPSVVCRVNRLSIFNMYRVIVWSTLPPCGGENGVHVYVICICICVCICICICIGICICMPVCLYVCMCVCLYVCMYLVFGTSMEGIEVYDFEGMYR